MVRYAFFLLLCCCCIVLPLIAYAAVENTSLVEAKAAILIDRQTGIVLWEKNADTRLPIASTTKIMTAMVILDLGMDKLDQQTSISQYAFATPGSSLLAAGEILTLRDLLISALVKSSNTAAVAAAEFLCGNEAEFVKRMNGKAHELGLRNTHFMNPHGLYDPQHYSTARDLAVMARYALTNYPIIRKTITLGRPPIYIDALPRKRVRVEATDKIINQPVPGIPGSIIDGVKTGFVNEAGKCLVSSATLGQWQLIAVVLKSPDHFRECRTLLHYGFSRYTWQTYASAQQPGANVPLSWGAARTIPVGVTEGVLGAPIPKLPYGNEVEDTIVFRGKRPKAPVQQGDVLGELVLKRDGQDLLSVPAVALQSVPVAWWARLLTVLGYTILVLFILTVLGKIYGTRAKNTRRRRRQLQATRRGIDPGGPSHS